ncbi:MAG: YeeE/YedE family protein [Desulfobacterales bacterium SG8_35]|nr:MAG: YeeE/YedE family protein [Desulfobacterales bacterium SG8_35]
MQMLIMGLLTGLSFGFLLQKARVVRYDKQIGALRFQDMTIIKFMMSAIIVGMVGIHFFEVFGLVQLMYKPVVIGENIAGGMIFGLGWGLLGYCPGTQGGALGEGRWDALWGILGMIVGAGLYAETYPFLMKRVLGWGYFGSLTIPQLIGVNQWLVISVFTAGVIALFFWFEKKGL